jgi:hypothetical protein
MPRKTVATRLPAKANVDVAKLMGPRIRGATAEYITYKLYAIPSREPLRSAA